MSLPAWEIPFDALGKVVLAVPEALTTVVKDVSAANSQLPGVAAQIDQFLSDATVAVTAGGLNIAIDAQVAKDFLAALASLKNLVAALK